VKNKFNKFFIMKLKNKFLIFLGLLFICVSMFVSCQKEVNAPTTSTNDIAVTTNENKPTNLIATSRSGNNLEATLDNIEENLNVSYGSPDQSIGEVNVTRTELTLDLNNGSLNEAQAEQIYDAALELWARNYESTASTNKEAIALDIDKVLLGNDRVKVTISSWVGLPQSEAFVAPCTPNFPTGNYLWSFVNAFSSGLNKYADLEFTKKFNQKPIKNNCTKLTEVQTIVLDPLSTSNILNNIIMDNDYCTIQSQINAELADNPGFSLVSVQVFGTTNTFQNPIFITTCTIGKKVTVTGSPCDPAPAPKTKSK
jgi:hypothetical protein